MDEHAKTEIFISYRRDGGVDYARMIFLELKGRGYETFFDYNSLRNGKFNEGIVSAIDECQYFILVLSNGALDRCMNEDDWVRHEIEMAISKGKAIIPVCPSGNIRGFPEKLPPSLEPLRMLQISMLQMDDLFEKSFDKIVEDRFAEDFRNGRAPVPKSDVVTVHSFKKIGIGVIVAIVAAAVIIGMSVMQKGSVEERRLQAETEAKEKAEARIQSEREARIRAEATADVAKGAAVAQKESETLKKLLDRETELATTLLTAKAQLQSLEKERENLNLQHGKATSLSEQEKIVVAKDKLFQRKDDVSKVIRQLTQELEAVRETIPRVRAIDAAYRGVPLDAGAVEEMEKAREELERTVARIVARRTRAESLKDRIPADALLRAKQLEGVANAEHKSLADALEKNKAADEAYGELLDNVVEDEIERAMETVDRLPEWSKWKTAVELLAKVVSIDPENERARKAYDNAIGCLAPSMTVTAELDGEPVPGVRFFANGKPADTPYHFVFEDSGTPGSAKITGVNLDAVYVKDGKNYAARRRVFVSWKGETNIVLQLRETPAEGTSIRLKLGRLPQSYLSMTDRERNMAKEVYVDFVWCPPGSDVVEYMDPETEEAKRVISSVDVGFWISRCELTGRQYNVLFGRNASDAGGSGGFWTTFSNREENRPPDDDRPALATHRDVFPRGPCAFYGDETDFRIPSVSEWFHAAHFGGFKVGEDDFADYAWCLENAGTNTSFAVGQKKANKLGLHDVYGNAPEWVSGSVQCWLGLREFQPGRDDDLAMLMGGGCADDFESATDLLLLKSIDWRNTKDKGGFRLVGQSEFQHEASLVEWVKAIDLLDSEDPSQREEGMNLLAGYATGSPDPSLRAESAEEYVARGGDPVGAGIAMTKDIRRHLVARCADDTELSRYATEDDDADIRSAAYKKLKNPSLEVSTRYLARIEDIKAANFWESDAYKIYSGCFFRKVEDESGRNHIVPQDGAEACIHHLALHAMHPKVRAQAVHAVTNAAVLKSVALNDADFYTACIAIKEINDRILLMEILEESKRKKVKAAARDRLKELSQ